jgi:hypothetical protein
VSAKVSNSLARHGQLSNIVVVAIQVLLLKADAVKYGNLVELNIQRELMAIYSFTRNVFAVFLPWERRSQDRLNGNSIQYENNLLKMKFEFFV